MLLKLETFQDPPPFEDLSFETMDGCMGVDLKKVLWSPSARPVKGRGPAGTHGRVDKCPCAYVEGTSDCKMCTA